MSLSRLTKFTQKIFSRPFDSKKFRNFQPSARPFDSKKFKFRNFQPSARPFDSKKFKFRNFQPSATDSKKEVPRIDPYIALDPDWSRG